jgi:hypothetical protein
MRTLHWALMASIAGALTAGVALPAAANHKPKHRHPHGYYYYPPPPPPVIYYPARPAYVVPPPVYYGPPVYAPPPGISLNLNVPLR